MGRSAVNRGIQVGVEVTEGVAVAANKSLPSLSFSFKEEVEHKETRTHGSLFNNTSRVHRQYASGSFEGPLSYTEIIYPLSSMCRKVAPTTPAGATNVRQWLFKPNPRGGNPYQTFTCERGDAEAAGIMAGAAFTDLEIDFAEKDLSVKGGMIGQSPVTGALTANPTLIGRKEAGANEVDVFISTSLATLFNAGNKVTDAMKENLKIGKNKGPKFVHNTDHKSYKDLITLPTDLSFELMQEHNAQSRALYDAIKTDNFRYVGVRCTGPQIEAGHNFLIETTIALHFYPDTDEDLDGVWAYKYMGVPVEDAALGSAYQIRVVNNLQSL